VHVVDDDELDLEGDWNLLRGRVVPAEVFVIDASNQPTQTRTHALLRLKCHGIKKGGKKDVTLWEVTLEDVLYEEPGHTLTSWRTRTAVDQKDTFPTLDAAVLALRERRKAQEQALRDQQAELRRKAVNLKEQANDIDEKIAGWPLLPEADIDVLMKNRVPLHQCPELVKNAIMEPPSDDIGVGVNNDRFNDFDSLLDDV